MPKNDATPVDKGEALRRLRDARLDSVADDLSRYEDKNRQGLGWDGWIRKAHPAAVPIVWPALFETAAIDIVQIDVVAPGVSEDQVAATLLMLAREKHVPPAGKVLRLGTVARLGAMASATVHLADPDADR